MGPDGHHLSRRMGEQIFINQMTTEELKQKLRDNLAAVEASEKGEPWEYKIENEWVDGTGMNIANYMSTHCRPCAKPDQLWSKPEHVPLNCWMRRKDSPRYSYLVAEIGPVGVVLGRVVRPWTDLYEYEHSTDRINWLPCIVHAPATPKPHNPDNLTPEQYGGKEGYRLLDEDEVGTSTKFLREIEKWDPIIMKWDHSMWIGVSHGTYRTLCSREELALKRRDGV